ncbi:Firmicu-CTERM sorting domain-containing protein [Coprococcus sp. AF19-8AC]|uniref:Firmicu-CTERM sorting domain-containing protein n=1 Tax=Coprococcus sp. AF19-8AC TaxID=2293090 RepID=UPI000E76B57B|nr:Firmicu-CTERM sorting domain-containing protein [Coprococcus sp. AF19-8AC]RJV47694.1 Firmicu-CTERM sorting domain-containing protein [Coprococcus sp. AF19-8AC]
MKNRRTKMKRLTGIITAICMVIIFSGVSIFGSQAQTFSDGNGGSMEVTTDGEYIYLEYSGSWTNYIQQIFDISVNGQTAPGALSKLVINTGNNGDGSSFNVLNAWYQAIDGATGYTTNTGASSSGWGYADMSWSAKVPVSTYGTDVRNITIGWNGNTAELDIAGDSSSSETTTEAGSEATTESADNSTEETTTKEVTEDTTEATEQVTESTTEQTTTEVSTSEKATENATTETGTTEEITGPVTSGLVIDGYYGEWSQYPSADITYNSNNGYSTHKGQLAVENGRLYVHFSMNDLYTSQMQFQLWNITVDGKSCVLNILPVNSNGSINWGGQTNGFGAGIYRNFGVFAGYYNDVDGDVAFTVYDPVHTETGKGDEIEFSISLDKLADYLGIKLDQGATITVSNPNIGAEGVTITGTPTGPWVGAAIALLMAVGGVIIYRRKRI